MATLRRDSDGREVQVTEGGRYSLQDAAQALNVTFRCRGGGCGACKATVVEGLENMSLPTRNEEVMRARGELGEDERLMCQARIVEGTVTIEPREPEFDGMGRLRRRPCPGQPIAGEATYAPA